MYWHHGKACLIASGFKTSAADSARRDGADEQAVCLDEAPRRNTPTCRRAGNDGTKRLQRSLPLRVRIRSRVDRVCGSFCPGSGIAPVEHVESTLWRRSVPSSAIDL